MTRRAVLGTIAVPAALAGVAGCAPGSGPWARGSRSDAEPPTEPRPFPELAGRTLRVVREGEAYTMDFRPDRFTVLLDQENRILRAFIG